MGWLTRYRRKRLTTQVHDAFNKVPWLTEADLPAGYQILSVEHNPHGYIVNRRTPDGTRKRTYLYVIPDSATTSNTSARTNGC